MRNRERRGTGSAGRFRAAANQNRAIVSIPKTSTPVRLLLATSRGSAFLAGRKDRGGATLATSKPFLHVSGIVIHNAIGNAFGKNATASGMRLLVTAL